MASKPRVVHLSSRSAKIFLHHSNTAPFGAVFLFLRRAANVSAEMEENGTSHSRGRDFLTHGLYPGGVTAPPAALRSSANANFCKNVGEWRQPFSGRDRRVSGFAANGVTTREDTSVSFKAAPTRVRLFLCAGGRSCSQNWRRMAPAILGASDPDIRRTSQSEVHAKSLEFRSGAKRTRPVSDKPKLRETSH